MWNVTEEAEEEVAERRRDGFACTDETLQRLSESVCLFAYESPFALFAHSAESYQLSCRYLGRAKSGVSETAARVCAGGHVSLAVAALR